MRNRCSAMILGMLLFGAALGLAAEKPKPVGGASTLAATTAVAARGAEVGGFLEEEGLSVWREDAANRSECTSLTCMTKGCDNSAGGCFCIWGLTGGCGHLSCKFGCQPAV